MILDVDMGNTRIKWLLRDDELNILQQGAFVEADLESNLIALPKSINSVRVASVRPSLHNRFDRLCEQHWQLKPEYASVSQSFAGVINAYDDIEQMGVDRWLGIIAASTLCSSSGLVVSAGSAMTVDLLDECRQHLGGFIVPGLRLMRESLYRDTDQVKLDNIDYDTELGAGKSTQEAVASGLVLMQLGLIQQSLHRLNASTVTIVVTGGDGELLCKMIESNNCSSSKVSVIYEPNLIFKGLALVFSS